MDGPLHIMPKKQRTVIFHHKSVVVILNMFRNRLHQRTGPGRRVGDDLHATAKKAGLLVKESWDGRINQGQRAGIDLVRVDNGVHVRAHLIDPAMHPRFNGGFMLSRDLVQIKVEDAYILRGHLHVIKIRGGDGKGVFARNPNRDISPGRHQKAFLDQILCGPNDQFPCCLNGIHICLQKLDAVKIIVEQLDSVKISFYDGAMAESNYHHGDLKNALIQAGVKILSKEGISGLSLRKVARQAGVSHAAPYAHFADKQALIAAISTEGYKQLYTRVEKVRKTYASDPAQLLIETAWSYIDFGLNEPDRFKLMFSSVLEKEKDYPDFVHFSKKNFAQIVSVIAACQEAGILRAGPSDLMAVSVWSAVHGLVMLYLEGQIPHSLLDRFSLKELLVHTLNQAALMEISGSGE